MKFPIVNLPPGGDLFDAFFSDNSARVSTAVDNISVVDVDNISRQVCNTVTVHIFYTYMQSHLLFSATEETNLEMEAEVEATSPPSPTNPHEDMPICWRPGLTPGFRQKMHMSEERAEELIYKNVSYE